ncbi:MAG: FGGY family carbohydrate kinase [Eubacteriales bacterium]|nr:FGGY family carbohydrate kinase [Eubacteriales bacterium]
MGKYFLGIDIGTSSCKAVLLDASANIVGAATVEYFLDYKHGGEWIEIDAEKWYAAAVEAIRACMENGCVKKEKIVSVGLSGQMVSLLGLNRNGNPVRPVIMWLDKRNIVEANELKDAMGQKINEITCNPVNQQFTLPKLLWVKKHEPECYAEIDKIVLSKDYIRYRLTGEFATDCNDASGTLMHDIRKNQWSHEILGELGIDIRMLPDIYYSTQITGRVTKRAAIETGLLEGTPVVAGSGDLGCENFASGTFEAGQCMMRLGSGAAITVPVKKPILDPNLNGPCSGYYRDGIWLIQGMTQAFGGVLRWVRDTFANGIVSEELNGNTFERLGSEAEKIPIGSEGIVFCPFINAAPYWKSHIKGAFIGISPAHTLGHFIRAAMEGAAFALKDAMTGLKQFGGVEIERCVVTGGGSRSRLWTQMIANLLDKELLITPEADACTGAAMMAAIGMGLEKHKLIDAFFSHADIRRVSPDGHQQETQAVYQRYVMAYGLLDTLYTKFK